MTAGQPHEPRLVADQGLALIAEHGYASTDETRAMAQELRALRARVEDLDPALRYSSRERVVQRERAEKAEAERDAAREALRALEDRVLLTGRLSPPCIICGANGPRFYQPTQHKCIERRQRLERERSALGEQP